MALATSAQPCHRSDRGRNKQGQRFVTDGSVTGWVTRRAVCDHSALDTADPSEEHPGPPQQEQKDSLVQMIFKLRADALRLLSDKGQLFCPPGS